MAGRGRGWRRMWGAMGALLAMVWLAGQVWGAALPTGGYYRVGRYWPVEVEGAGAEVVVEGEGVLRTRVAGVAGRVLAPVLVTGEITALRVGDEAVDAAALRALGDRQRLVAGRRGEGAALFGDAEVIEVPVEGLLRSPRPALAWTVLDGVMLEAGEYAALPGEVVDVLSAAGCVVAVRTDRPPDERAWRAEGAWQVLRVEVLGPRGMVVHEAAYGPTQAWVAGWSGGMRRNLVLAGLAVGVLACAAAGMRRGRAVVGVMGVAVVGALAVMGWRQATPPVFQTGGSVVVRLDGVVQRDAWAYQTSRHGGRAGYAVGGRGVTWPVFASRGHRERVGMELRCGWDGSPLALVYELPAGGMAGFVTRSLDAGQSEPAGGARAAGSTAMETLVGRIYRGARMIERDRGGPGRLGRVVLATP